MKKVIECEAFKLIPALKPSDSSAIVIDRLNYFSGIVLLSSGNATGSNTVKVRVQHGAKSDGSDMADFKPEGAVIETDVLVAADTSATVSVDLTGAKRYIKLVATTTGTAPTMMAQVLLADGSYGEEY